MFLFNSQYHQCPFDCFIEILKGKWRTTILLLLASGPKRFAHLKKGIDGISAKVLSENLQILEDGGILHREVYPVIPPTVEYSLTPAGMALVDIMNNINEWSNRCLTKQ
ncbi:MAG: helix-turn-helix domain-containing protein [Sporomusaceae bacterium]|nr:helix-turn-helix domain-containing protein [Sporomusaceae bacterium]